MRKQRFYPRAMVCIFWKNVAFFTGAIYNKNVKIVQLLYNKEDLKLEKKKVISLLGTAALAGAIVTGAPVTALAAEANPENGSTGGSSRNYC